MNEDLYFFKARGRRALTNMSAACSQCRNTADAKLEVVGCSQLNEKRRRKRIEREGHEFYYCSARDIKSARRFKDRYNATYEAMISASERMYEDSRSVREQLKRQLHNLVKMNAQAMQNITATFPSGAFQQGSRTELIRTVEATVREKPEAVAKLIVDLLKNENLKKTEFAVYNKIFESDDLEIRAYGVHKVVILVLNLFWQDFFERSVYVEVGESFDTVLVDFDAMATVLVHVFQNALKYTLPDSKLQIDFERDEGGEELVLVFRMDSFGVYNEEINRIFEEGYSGHVPRQLKREGDGVGLWIVRSLMESMGGWVTMHFDVLPERRKERMGVEYTVNEVRMGLRRSTDE